MYNCWYSNTYDEIFSMADWSNFGSDVAKKISCIFSWMPQTIMGIKDKGGGKLWQRVSLSDLQSTLNDLASTFDILKDKGFNEYASYRGEIVTLYEGLVTKLKPTATSKFLHFSNPNLFPMWDNYIRGKKFKLSDTAEGYLGLIEEYCHKYRDSQFREKILLEYPKNFVRAFDIHLMKNRNGV